MTFAFSAYFVTVWLTGVLAVPAAAALAIRAAFVAESTEWRIAFAAGAVLSLLWTIFLRMHSQRVLIRAGACPNFCTHDSSPSPLSDAGAAYTGTTY